MYPPVVQAFVTKNKYKNNEKFYEKNMENIIRIIIFA